MSEAGTPRSVSRVSAARSIAARAKYRSSRSSGVSTRTRMPLWGVPARRRSCTRRCRASRTGPRLVWNRVASSTSFIGVPGG
jgi:hypothetical protein